MKKKSDSSRRILIAVTSDLTTDQRVLKVAGTFHAEGWQVMLVGRLLPDSKAFESDYRHRRMNLIFTSGFLFYLEFNLRLFIKALFCPHEFIYANDTDTLTACYLASAIRRKKLIFDAHELFPEVPELQQRHFVKKVWQTIENLIIPRLNRTLTVCESIAGYYNQKYGIDMQVVRNVPYLREYTDSISLPVENGKKIILYQGALNTGRGLEWVIEAMPQIDNAILYIIGDGDLREQLKQQVSKLKLNDRVVFHGKVDASELYRYTPSADLGLCLLENKGLSYYFSLPNRIFDYLHAGVPVLSSPFPEIKKIVETYKTGILSDEHSPDKLASLINKILKEGYPTAHFKQLTAEFCWEKEQRKLLGLI
ncbi:MAG: glycosyltransferase family 4 protein [Paludibacter sp.]|jgi:glycosyltransferase involved in cell wall biosynthesis|nr:glycosyltransferase family 4 protein [Paludibacter sp.]